MSIYDKASLVLIPSGTKTSKVYSQKPTNGDGDFTFSRSTAATRVNASGNIEKETENLLSASNDFDNNTYWSFTNVSVVSGQAGYDGTNDAFKIVENTADGQHIIQQSELSVGVVQCISVYAKAAGRDWLMINQSGIRRTYYDLANGVMGTIQGNVIEATITDVGGGWYRCTYTAVMDYTGLRIGPTASNGANTYTGDGTSGILVQDAQLEQGLVARDYIETTTTAIYGGITDNVPRLDYTDSSCPALLLEPQRTNNIPHSEYFGSGSGWSYFNNVSVGNFVLSPEGKMNATELVFDGSTSGRLERTISGLTAGADYSVSLYARVASGTQNVFFGSYESEVFTLTTEWQRLERTQPENDTNAYPRIACDDAATIEIWGFQHEAGSYPTSYIPTYGSAVTRNEEIFKTENIQTNGLITPTAWTLFFNYNVTLDTANQYRDLIAIYGSKSFRLETRTNGQVRAQQSGMVISGDNFNAQTIGTTSNTKFAITFTTSQVKIYVDGVLVSTYNGAYEHDFNVLNVRNSNTLGTESELKYKQVLLFPTALTDQEAIDLTTI